MQISKVTHTSLWSCLIRLEKQHKMEKEEAKKKTHTSKND